MHNKPYTVDASKITRVLPDFTYIPLAESARAAADSVVAMGLANFPTPGCLGLWGLGARLAQLCSAWGNHAACVASSAVRTASVGGAAAATATAVPAARSCESQDGQSPQEVLIEGAESDDEHHGVMTVVISPAGSNSKLPRLDLSAIQLVEMQQGGVQQV